MFSHTRIYAVYVKPDMPHGERQPVLVREGFNLFAFLLGVFWALYHRLWWVSLALFAFNLAIVYVVDEGWLSEPSTGIIQMGVQALVGFQAADWRQAKLRRKGYVLADVAAADSQVKAEQRYFERALSEHVLAQGA